MAHISRRACSGCSTRSALFLSCKPFEVSVAPKTNPLEITLRGSDAWHPYARTLAVTQSKLPLVTLEFATTSFTPIVNNFMVLY